VDSRRVGAGLADADQVVIAVYRADPEHVRAAVLENAQLVTVAVDGDQTNRIEEPVSDPDAALINAKLVSLAVDGNIGEVSNARLAEVVATDARHRRNAGQCPPTIL